MPFGLVKSGGEGLWGPLVDNLSLDFRVYPEALEEAVIIPLFKKPENQTKKPTPSHLLNLYFNLLLYNRS